MVDYECVGPRNEAQFGHNRFYNKQREIWVLGVGFRWIPITRVAFRP